MYWFAYWVFYFVAMSTILTAAHRSSTRLYLKFSRVTVSLTDTSVYEGVYVGPYLLSRRKHAVILFDKVIEETAAFPERYVSLALPRRTVVATSSISRGVHLSSPVVRSVFVEDVPDAAPLSARWEDLIS